MTVTDWIRVAGVVSTLLAVLVALFKDELWRWLRCPKLIVSIQCGPPDCHGCQTTWPGREGAVIDSGYWYYLRLWVYNGGYLAAENVTIFANKLYRATAPYSYVEVRSFLPMNLLWAHTREPYRKRISPGLGRHCDLGHVADPATKSIHGETRADVQANRTIFCMELESKPYTLPHLLQPGDYKLELIVAADNSKPIRITVKIDLTGEYYQTEEEMFSKGVRVSIP